MEKRRDRSDWDDIKASLDNIAQEEIHLKKEEEAKNQVEEEESDNKWYDGLMMGENQSLSN